MFPDLTRDDVLTLETARLRLRWPHPADAVSLKAVLADADMATMTGDIPHPLPERFAENEVFRARRLNATGAGLALAITRKSAPGSIIGLVAVVAGPPEDAAMLTVRLASDARGDGLATEAARGLLDAVFALTEVPAVCAAVRVIDPASRRVLKKCGFAQDGTAVLHLPARGGATPCDLYRIDRRMWESLKSWSFTARSPFSAASAIAKTAVQFPGLLMPAAGPASCPTRNLAGCPSHPAGGDMP